MIKLAAIVTVIFGLLAAEGSQQQVVERMQRDDCVRRCYVQVLDPELRRQELISLEKEAVRAIELRNGSYFRRVYSDDFTGTLSHGQQVDKAQWIDVIQSGALKYDSFNSSDIKVQIYGDMAVATCLWSARFTVKGQHFGHQMRAIHIYLNGASGWHVVSGQITSLPPDVQEPL